MEIQCIWSGPADLGEGPLWHPKEELLYFIDIAKKMLYSIDPESYQCCHWQLPEYIGCVVAKKKGGLLATLGQYVVSIDLPSGKITKHIKVIPDHRPDLRMNDGKLDRAGRLWFGVANTDVENPKGGLFCYEPDGTLTEKESHITISNGLGFSPDNKTFYFTDGLKYRIYSYDFDLNKGEISNRKVFVQLDKSPIEPDGLTIDSQGYVWQAQWNNPLVHRFSPDGQIDKTIEMPVSRPTNCMIGGKKLDTLFITSCSKSIGETIRLPSPAGSLFAIKIDVPGLEEPYFDG